MLGLGQAEATKKCQWCCKWLPCSAFATNAKTGALYGKCETCRPKHLASNNSSPNRAAITKRYKDSDAGKASNKRYKAGEAGKASASRFAAKRTKRRHQSAAMRLDDTIMAAANRLIGGRQQTSPTFLQRTAFATESHFLSVVSASCERRGFHWDDHGATWEVDHKIPREAYDFDDPDDVRRCWSGDNVHVLSVADNAEKSWKLLDHWIASAGPGCFPAAWQGRAPTEEMKQAHHDKMLAAKALADAEARESLEAPDSVADDEEDDDSDSAFEGESMQGAGSST
jgi:hypothetical protein